MVHSEVGRSLASCGTWSDEEVLIPYMEIGFCDYFHYLDYLQHTPDLHILSGNSFEKKVLTSISLNIRRWIMMHFTCYENSLA